MSGAQGGMLLILAAVVLAVLWYRGYLASWTADVVALLGGNSVNLQNTTAPALKTSSGAPSTNRVQ